MESIAIENDKSTIELAGKLGELHANLLPPISVPRSDLISSADELEQLLRKWLVLLKKQENYEISGEISSVLQSISASTTKEIAKALRKSGRSCTKKMVNSCLYEYPELFVKEQVDKEAPVWSLYQ